MESLQIRKMIDSLWKNNKKSPKDQIIHFLKQLKELGPAEKYTLNRENHLSYVFYLFSIKEDLQQKNYEEVVYFLRYHLIEHQDLIRQPRFYANLIYILENFERDEIGD